LVLGFWTLITMNDQLAMIQAHNEQTWLHVRVTREIRRRIYALCDMWGLSAMTSKQALTYLRANADRRRILLLTMGMGAARRRRTSFSVTTSLTDGDLVCQLLVKPWLHNWRLDSDAIVVDNFDFDDTREARLYVERRYGVSRDQWP
jgi:hypothetical protein